MYKILPPIGNTDKTIQLEIRDLLIMGGDENFLIGKNKILHGGVHLKSTNKNQIIQSIADGKIIAYRLDAEYKKYYPDHLKPEEYLEYSTSFILIEHDFEYETDLEQNKALFKNYKFYSLYMHLAPLSEFNEASKGIPPIFSMKKNILLESQKIPIGSSIFFEKKPNFNESFLECKLNDGLLDVWLEKNKIRVRNSISKKFELSETLDYVFLKSTSNPNAMLQDIKYDQVVDLTNNPIYLKAGDHIGYFGKNIGENTATVHNSFHFEIFTDIGNLPFLDNSESNDYFTNDSLTTLSPPNTFMAGKFYKQRTSRGLVPQYDEFMSIYTSMDQNNISLYNEISLNQPESPVQAPSTNYPTLATDMNWTLGNESWVKLSYQEICDNDYAVNEQKVNELSPNKNKKTICLLTHSEWAKSNVEQRYQSLRRGKRISQNVKIPKLHPTDYQNFIKFAKNFCFWEEVRSLPDYKSIACFNPIYFLDRMQRCTNAFSFLNSTQTSLYLKIAINNTEYLLKKRLNSLKEWKKGGYSFFSSDGIHSEFKKWFGYSKGEIASQPSAYTVHSGGQQINVPNIRVLSEAVDYVINLIELQLDTVHKNLSLLNFMSGVSYSNSYYNTCAYVYFDSTVRKHIFLCYYFLFNDIINNNGKYTIRNLKSKKITEEAVNTICHELSHFNDLGALRDVSIQLMFSTNDPIGPYGDIDCMDIAKIYPSAALLNADNFSFFIQGKNFKNVFKFY